MQHYYKLHLHNSPIDLFFTAVNMIEKTFTFKVVTKEGKVITHPESGIIENVIEFKINGDAVYIEGMGQIEKFHLDAMQKYFSEPLEELKNAV